ncbi:hypothetical protein KDL45_02070, partial [bacterium]|nr:hypothetical protein [bacterium]
MIRFRRSKFFKYRGLPFALCFLVGLLMTVAGPAMGSPESRADKATPAPEPVETKGNGEVLLVSLDGTVNPGSADFFRYALERATAGSYEALVIQLDTPGGLVDSTRDIVQGFLNSTTPVVVYVAPQGARAGSAGVMITLAAHVAAMAPSTNIGAAHPVAGGGQEMDETMTAKITNDTAAWIEGIAEQRGRNKE